MTRLGPFEENTIVVGDCLDIMAQMPDGCVDLVVTDPPFFTPAIHYQSRISWGRNFGDLSTLGHFFFRLCDDFKRITKEDGNVMIFCHDESYPVLYIAAYGLWDFTAALVWDKCRIGLGKTFRHQFELILWASNQGAFHDGRGIMRSDVLKHKAPLSRDRLHPVQKSEGLIRQLIEVCSRESGVIFDPFIGSGTTAVVADRLGRNFFGCDINPDYVEIALERLEKDRAARQLELL